MDIANILLEKENYSDLTSEEKTEYKKVALELLRDIRTRKLKHSDMNAIIDWPFKDDAEKQGLLTYRQALRDITETYPEPQFNHNTFKLKVDWPEVPDCVQIKDETVMI
jgi:hypothetical protein